MLLSENIFIQFWHSLADFLEFMVNHVFFTLTVFTVIGLIGYVVIKLLKRNVIHGAVITFLTAFVSLFTVSAVFKGKALQAVENYEQYIVDYWNFITEHAIFAVSVAFIIGTIGFFIIKKFGKSDKRERNITILSGLLLLFVFSKVVGHDLLEKIEHYEHFVFSFSLFIIAVVLVFGAIGYVVADKIKTDTRYGILVAVCISILSIYILSLNVPSSFEHWLEHVAHLLRHNNIYNVGIMITFGLIGGKIIERVNFPKVTGYILMGILIGPSIMNLLSHETLEYFMIIRQVAIGFIGYTIGLELRLSKLKKTGKQVTIITLAQAFATAILVCMAVVSYLSVTGGSYIWTYGLILGAIATATAPGPIIAVVKNYRTRGPVTDVLLPLVALDDAIGIMLFATMLSLGTAILSGGDLSVGNMILEPVKEIGMSFGFGAILGFSLSYIVKKFNRDDDKMLLMMIIGTVFLGIGIGQAVHASAILLPMTIGVVLTNTIDEAYEHRLTKATDLFSAPVLLAFFTIAGAELDLSKLLVVGLLGGIYIIVRVVGKVSGSYVSARAVKAPPTVIKYLGFTLIPQAGVAIDMAITADQRFAGMPGFEFIGTEIMTIVLAATVIYEVLGLVVVKTALGKAGEIDAANVGWK